MKLLVTIIGLHALLIVIGLALFATGCGPVNLELDTAGEPIQQLEQPLITQVSDTDEECATWSGVMFESAPLNGLTYRASMCGSDNNQYFVPRLKALTFKVEQGVCSASQYSAFSTKIDSIFAELNTAASIGAQHGWSFTRSSTGAHLIRCHSLPVSPVGGLSIRNFSRTQCSVDFDFNVHPEDGVPGNINHYKFCVVQVDVPDIMAKGTSATQDDRLLFHALCHGIIKLAGVGEKAGNPVMACSDTTISPATAGRVMFSLGERCRTRNYSNTQQNNLYISDSAGCSEN